MILGNKKEPGTHMERWLCLHWLGGMRSIHGPCHCIPPTACNNWRRGKSFAGWPRTRRFSFFYFQVQCELFGSSSSSSSFRGEAWLSYIERLQAYFVANDVADTKKQATFYVAADQKHTLCFETWPTLPSLKVSRWTNFFLFSGTTTLRSSLPTSSASVSTRVLERKKSWGATSSQHQKAGLSTANLGRSSKTC